MKKGLLFFGIIIAIILVVVFSGTFDSVSSIIPGWHTTIYPLWFIVMIIAVPVLMIVLLIKYFKVIIKRK